MWSAATGARAWLLLAVAVLAACSGAPTPSRPDPPPAGVAAAAGATMTVMTWNVRGDLESPRRREPGDPPSYADAIAAEGADVVGLQEISRDEARQVTEQLRWGSSCAAAPTCFHTTVDFVSGEGTAVLSRYPFVRPTAQWLLAPAPGDHPRYLQRVTIAPHGRPVNVYDTHLTNLGEAARDAQAADVLRLVREDAERTAVSGYVLLGDLNAAPGEASVRALAAAAPDACTVRTARCRPTIPVRDNARQTRATPSVRVDHVFVDRMTVREAHVPDPGALVPHRDGAAADMRWWQLSDHLPVVATLSPGP
jgi:endonuclease/exonuclease/phosphatase family metal-dependent hydrolase